MKLIIELDDDITKGIRGKNDCEVEPREIVRSFQATIADAIKNGTPVTEGDLIMFRILMTEIANKGLPFEEVLLLIDNAPTVPQVTVFTESADEKAVEDLKAELQSVIESRPKGEREFIELEVKYLPDDITPTDYRGKPYYSIHYKENGEEFVGFGTYKPEVLSKYLKENFMQGGAS